MRITRDQSIVPVLMFHSVEIGDRPWIWSTLCESLETFEGTLARLAANGFRTVKLADLYAHMSGSRRLSGHNIVLTFDDGYLDNWINAVPLLRKYGMCATVYVTPEFIEQEAKPRQQDTVAGFMNWEELREADSEGVLDVQCHALTHTWYFAGPTVIDIHRPTSVTPYPWLLWNARPDRKPFYLNENQQEYVPWGHPVFEHEKSLVVRKFTPDRSQVDAVSEYVAKQGGKSFFDRPAWHADLNSRFPELESTAGFAGDFETDEAYRARVFDELSTSRKIIEREINKQVEFLAWPGGGVNGVAVELAKKAGFKSWTLSSWQKPDYKNQPGANAREIKRVSGRSRVRWRDRTLKDAGAAWIVTKVLIHQGSLMSRAKAAIRKLVWIVASYARVRPKFDRHDDGSC